MQKKKKHIREPKLIECILVQKWFKDCSRTNNLLEHR